MNKERRVYCIYAIVADKKVYIGKTTSDDHKSILWKHQRGEIKHTRKHFMRGCSVVPIFVPLEHVQTDFSMAYRHEIPHLRFFMDEGYKVLNSAGMIKHTCDIHPLTLEILDSLKRAPWR